MASLQRPRFGFDLQSGILLLVFEVGDQVARAEAAHLLVVAEGEMHGEGQVRFQERPRLLGGGLQAVAMAAMMVQSGAADVVMVATPAVTALFEAVNEVWPGSRSVPSRLTVVSTPLVTPSDDGVIHFPSRSGARCSPGVSVRRSTRSISRQGR